MNRALKPLGLQPAGLGTVERNTVDVGAAVKAIMAQKPDAIVQISAYKSCAAFIRAARKAGFTGTFYNVSFVGTAALAKELGADARGVVVAQVMPYPYAPLSPVSGEYIAAGKAALGDKFDPNYSSMEGYVAAKTDRRGAAPRRQQRHARKPHHRPGIAARVQPRRLLRRLRRRRSTPARKYVDLTILTADGRVRH